MICSRLMECTKEEVSQEKKTLCMNGNRPECVHVSDKRSEVKCEEKGKKYILKNTMKNHIILYQIDGGVIVADKLVPEGTSKCDFLFVICKQNPEAILTELKGVDVRKSLKQLEGTLRLFKDYFRTFSKIYGRVIVTSSTPKLKATPEYVKLVKLLSGTYHGNLRIEERQFTETDTELEQKK